MIKPRRLRWADHVTRIEEGSSALKMLACKATGKRVLGRPMRKWEGDIRVDIKEIGDNAKNFINWTKDGD